LKVFSRLAAATVVLFAATGVSLGLTGATPVHAASGPQFCESLSGTWCLNDWFNGGLNNSVKSFSPNNTNEGFVEQLVGRCGGFVTATCPFANRVFDNRYNGFPIVQLQYQPNGLCIATDSSALAVLGHCNNTGTGFGGSNGTLFVDHNGFLINLFWTNQGLFGNNAACMIGDPGNGNAVRLDLETTQGCPVWGQF
jgi:hypothetical protein